MYKIKYNYWDGDSGGSHDYEKELEFTWTDYDEAVDALDRIRQHYTYYHSMSSPFMDIQEPPVWWKPVDSLNPEYCVNLLVDGKEVTFRCPWCSWSSGLYGAKVVRYQPPLASFTVKLY